MASIIKNIKKYFEKDENKEIWSKLIVGGVLIPAISLGISKLISLISEYIKERK